MLEYILHLSSA